MSIPPSARFVGHIHFEREPGSQVVFIYPGDNPPACMQLSDFIRSAAGAQDLIAAFHAEQAGKVIPFVRGAILLRGKEL